jgi:hypothetical protein
MTSKSPDAARDEAADDQISLFDLRWPSDIC